MAWVEKCSPRIQALIREGCAWALEPDYLSTETAQRHLDFLEVYSGQGRLNGMIGKAWGLLCFFWYWFGVVVSCCPLQVMVTNSFEVFDDVRQNILTRPGQLLCISDTKSSFLL